MNLPNASAVEIAKEKVTDYLLNPLRPDGAPKAAFFAAMGFAAEEWEILANAIRELAVTSKVAKEVNSPHGAKYIVDGPLATPIGKTAWVRTVWIIDQGADTPRLVSAYPHKRGD